MIDDGPMKAGSSMGRRLLALAALLLGLFLQSAPAAAQTARQIVFFNDCFRPVRIMISHADQPQGWHPHAWWSFQPNERSYLVWEGRRLLQLDKHDIFFLAEATDGSRVYWSGEDHRVQWEGRTYSLRRALTSVQGDDLEIRLTCEPGR